MRDIWRIASAETLGTFLLVLAGPGAGLLAGEKIGAAGVALSIGFLLVSMAYAVGPISGCHLNPAVTVGLWLHRSISAGRVGLYVASQVVGALLARLIMFIVASGRPGFSAKESGFASNGFDAGAPPLFGAVAAGLMLAVGHFHPHPRQRRVVERRPQHRHRRVPAHLGAGATVGVHCLPAAWWGTGRGAVASARGTRRCPGSAPDPLPHPPYS